MKSLLLFFLLIHTALFAQNEIDINNTSLVENEKILYRGFINIVEISGNAPDSPTLYATGCTAERDPQNPRRFLVKANGSAKKVLFSVLDKNNEIVHNCSFEVRRIPPLTIRVSGLNNSSINKNARKFEVTYEESAFLEPNIRIMSFEMHVEGKVYRANGNILTPEMRKALSVLNTGNTVQCIFRAISPDGPARQIAGTFTVQN